MSQTISHCCDPKGTECFAYMKGRCKCLTDTNFKNTNHCPFFKTREQILKEDPDYFTRGNTYE